MPGLRKNASMAFIADTLYIFGGMTINEDEEELLVSDEQLIMAYTVDPATGDLTQTDAAFPGDAPCSRINGKLLPYGTNLLLNGGLIAGNKNVNDTWVLDLKAKKWKQVYTADGELCPPGGAIVAVMGQEVVSLNMAPGSTRYDLVQSIEPAKAAASFGFIVKESVIVPEELDYLEAMMDELEGGFALSQDLEKLAGDFPKLLQVMGCLFKIRTTKAQTDEMIDNMYEKLLLLAKGKVKEVPAYEKRIIAITERFNEIKKNVPIVKNDVQPIQDVEGERIKGRIQEFATKVDEYRRAFLDRSFFFYKTGYTTAYPELGSTNAELMELEKETGELKGLADMFEFPEIIVPTMDVMKECREDLGLVKDVWDTSALVEQQFSDWRTTLWGDIRTDMMEDGTKGYVKDVKGLPKKIRTADCYTGLDLSVKNFLVSIPLVSDLRSPDMRPRHWDALMATTGVKFVIDEKFKLDDLLALQLHKFEDEVGEIVDCAQNEAKMEVSLKKLNEVWSKVEWVFIQHKDTDVNTIKIGEEDFEALEDNQVLVQGMMANRYMKTFETEILGWNKKLMALADVNQIMSEIQRTWAYLESLFIHSE
jgi:dynein heavy chain